MGMSSVWYAGTPNQRERPRRYIANSLRPPHHTVEQPPRRRGATIATDYLERAEQSAKEIQQKLWPVILPTARNAFGRNILSDRHLNRREDNVTESLRPEY